MVTSEDLIAVMRPSSGLERAWLPTEWGYGAVMATLVARTQLKPCCVCLQSVWGANGHEEDGNGFHHPGAEV